MRPAGLEPAAYWFEASRSIQLSYGRENFTKTCAQLELNQQPLPSEGSALSN